MMKKLFVVLALALGILTGAAVISILWGWPAHAGCLLGKRSTHLPWSEAHPHIKIAASCTAP